jgi:hypothetical protein
MRSHNRVSIQLKTFAINTVLKAFEQDVFVFVSDKKINPVDYGK